jgi:hypothetical protein
MPSCKNDLDNYDTVPVKYPREDEKIHGTTYRQKVPGGWVVKDYYEISVSNCFVPDKNHEWILED